MANALLLALALLAQDGQVSASTSPNAPPTDEYGYVAWCYGALGGYASLYDQVMPEVTRIEKAFPGPDGVQAALKTYPEMRAQAQKDLKTFSTAITAAEKASPRPISEYGGAQVKRGAAIWQGAASVDKARLAQMWMSWSPPGDCEKRAKALEMKSSILGRALNYNAGSATTPTPTAPPQAKPSAPPPAAAADTPKPEAPKPRPEVAKPAPTASAPASAKAAAPAKKLPLIGGGEIIVDPVNPVPCAGSLLPAKRGGRDVLICKPD
ncbi:hypothetical protein [Caulobacter sp. BP25]|uniref:hypothetical protein n=1 Tax=Caulobacter sp. BP25 TaxID=2048900 RepID=UPI000C12A471|nr:hypothetical protein [Caulobacter sp. BP25]PHY22348.1 hypothetical protein CSW59_02700 [Caulobacter sp. BP25]